jgi:predicted membrane channel-forming protein YqfA (hemolysin III family)
MIALIITLALVGLIVYLITTYIPMPPIFKTVIYVIVAVVLILYLMKVLGIGDIPIR